MQENIDARYRTLIILWFALLMSIGSLFLVAQFLAAKIPDERASPPSSVLIVVLTALGTFLVIISFAVKRKLLERSVEQQDATLVQKALLIACVICEASALLGLLERFVIGYREYYLLFLLALAGTALHFPRRGDLLAASYKTPIDGPAS